MAIKILTEELEPKWRQFVEKAADATIYHTLEWKEIAQVFGHQPIYLLSIEETNGQVSGILPLYYVQGLLGRRIVSVSLRDRGGPIFDNEHSLFELLRYAIDLAKRKKCNYLELKNINQLAKSVAENLALEQKQSLIQTQIEIDADKEKIWKRMHQKSVRWAITKSKKEGVRVRWSGDRKGIAEFYRLFVATRHRLGVPVYSYNLFENIYQNFISKGWAGCILAEYKHRPIAGMIFLAYHGTIIEAYAASDRRFLHLRPNNLLLWELLCWGADQGFAIFDLGCDPANNKGLLEFKSRWGGRQRRVSYYYYYCKRCNVLNAGSPRFDFLRRGWRRLPGPLTKMIGPFLANQMS